MGTSTTILLLIAVGISTANADYYGNDFDQLVVERPEHPLEAHRAALHDAVDLIADNKDIIKHSINKLSAPLSHVPLNDDVGILPTLSLLDAISKANGGPLDEDTRGALLNMLKNRKNVNSYKPKPKPPKPPKCCPIPRRGCRPCGPFPTKKPCPRGGCIRSTRPIPTRTRPTRSPTTTTTTTRAPLPGFTIIIPVPGESHNQTVNDEGNRPESEIDYEQDNESDYGAGSGESDGNDEGYEQNDSEPADQDNKESPSQEQEEEEEVAAEQARLVQAAQDIYKRLKSLHHIRH